MYCPNCGKRIPKGSRFCPYCGHNISANININNNTMRKLRPQKPSHVNYYNKNYYHETNTKRISKKARIMFACLIGVVLVGGIIHHTHNDKSHNVQSINLSQQLRNHEYTSPVLARSLNKPATKVNFLNSGVEPNIGTKNSDGSVSSDENSYYVHGRNLVIYDPSWKFEKVRLKLINASGKSLTFKCLNHNNYSDISDTLSGGSQAYNQLKGHTITFTNRQKAHPDN